MRLVRRYQHVFFFLAVLAFCTVKVIGQFNSNETKHAELREYLILLQTKGYIDQAQSFYQKLVCDLESQSDKLLFEDYQRTSMLISTNQPEPENLVWRYHWQVKKELEKRTPERLAHALELAGEN